MKPLSLNEGKINKSLSILFRTGVNSGTTERSEWGTRTIQERSWVTEETVGNQWEREDWREDTNIKAIRHVKRWLWQIRSWNRTEVALICLRGK